MRAGFCSEVSQVLVLYAGTVLVHAMLSAEVVGAGKQNTDSIHTNH